MIRGERARTRGDGRGLERNNGDPGAGSGMAATDVRGQRMVVAVVRWEGWRGGERSPWCRCAVRWPRVNR